MKIHVLIILLLTVCLLGAARAAAACGCLSISVEKQFERATLVFAGKASGFEYRKDIPNSIAAEHDGATYETLTVNFEVEQWWKGAPSKNIFLIQDAARTSTGYSLRSSCDIHFDVGQTYLVYASGKESSYHASICTRTTRLTNAQDDLKFLGEGQSPIVKKDTPQRDQTKSEPDFKKTGVVGIEGQKAYRALLKAQTFSIGPVGWTAQQSANELALRIILREKEAVEILKNLLHNATPEGSLYALFGLKVSSPQTFIQELADYKLMPPPPARPRNGWMTIAAGEVIVQSGCVSRNAPLKSVISKIEDGGYDNDFKLNKQGSDVKYILPDGRIV